MKSFRPEAMYNEEKKSHKILNPANISLLFSKTSLNS